MRIFGKLKSDDDPQYGKVLNARVLIAGAHRVEAFKRLGMQDIECLCFDADDEGARMLEIAENLHRAELTALERDEHIAEWIKLANKLAQIAPVSKGGRGNESGVRRAARDLGIDRDDARRATKVAGLSDEAKQAARETGLDKNRSALLAAARKEKDGQEAAIRAEHTRREEEERRKKADKASGDAKRVVESEASENFAEWLVDQLGSESIPTIITFLQTSKPGDVIAALRMKAAS